MTSLAFLIDTDWVIDHFNAGSYATRRLNELQPHGLGLSVISEAELWEGSIFREIPNLVRQRWRNFFPA
jgi:hypothetical protein